MAACAIPECRRLLEIGPYPRRSQAPALSGLFAGPPGLKTQ
jgi:hypothetical protein